MTHTQRQVTICVFELAITAANVLASSCFDVCLAQRISAKNGGTIFMYNSSAVKYQQYAVQNVAVSQI